jgi:hypothetical protein
MLREPVLFALGGRWRGTNSGAGSIYSTRTSKRLHGDLPSPVLALQDPKPATLRLVKFGYNTALVPTIPGV